MAVALLVFVVALEAWDGGLDAVADSAPVMMGLSILLLGFGSWASGATRDRLGYALLAASLVPTGLALARVFG